WRLRRLMANARRRSCGRHRGLRDAMMLRTLVAIGWSILLALPASAERLRWSSQGDALSLDPHANNETMTLRFLSNIYDALVTRDQDLKIVPWLATEWKIVEPTRWRFSLRHDVKFH